MPTIIKTMINAFEHSKQSSALLLFLISASFIAWTARTSPQSSLPQQQEKQSFEEQTNRDSDDTDVSPTIAQPQEQSPVDSNKQYLAKLKLELAKKWPNNRTIKVVAHGHSVPTGYFRGGRVETFSAYPHLLHRKIAKSYPTAVVSMMPTGIGGENAPQGMLRFEEDVLALKPDVVTIDYGLNDRTVGLKKARDAWSKMILAAKKHGVKVILLTPTGDLNADILDDDDPLSQHAAQIRELAAEHQVGLVDSYKIFREFAKRNGEYKTLMSQGNHPNRKGHLLVADELATWFSTQSD